MERWARYVQGDEAWLRNGEVSPRDGHTSAVPTPFADSPRADANPSPFPACLTLVHPQGSMGAVPSSLSLAATALSPGLGQSSSGRTFSGSKAAASEQRGLVPGEQAVPAPFPSSAPAHGTLPYHFSLSSAAKCSGFAGSGVTKVPRFLTTISGEITQASYPSTWTQV